MTKNLLLLTASSLIALASCKKEDPKTNPPFGPSAKIMFVHNVLNADTLKVKINDTLLESVSGLTYGARSNYVSVRAGSDVKTTLFYPNSGLPLTSHTTSLVENGSYSFFATGTAGLPEILFVTDDLSAPAAGKAKVRFANLSGDVNSISSYIGTDSTATNLLAGTITSFKEVAAGTYDISMGDILPNSRTIDDQVLAAGKIYTFIYTGLSTGTGNFALQVIAIPNN